ncbi:helix-turn-helix domain-containing protein [Pedobacter agri]|uniref:helix-turn-helix domain-containing protein n=1 Tax=Pedobacter agri TaxID=454586 RepID=UPI00292E856A|nr:AraC family transcriptional regulator [Pedobacter agri]
MEEIKRVDTVGQYNQYVGVNTLHPLVSVVNLDAVKSMYRFRQYMNVYAIFLKDKNCGAMSYGGQPYDYDEGTLVFVAPGQIYGVDSELEMKPSGYALIFQPDLLKGSQLGNSIKNYSFFSYQVSEALHLSQKERSTIIECLEKITGEMEQNLDQHSKTLIISHLELLLNYCTRFYDRQFITRNHSNKDVLVRFEKLLTEYFDSGQLEVLGIPSVSWCAGMLFFSSNYFGDLIKKETGSTALDYIQTRVIEVAKTRLFDVSKSIHDVATELGFKYPHHFTRLFKRKVGLTPNDFRHVN